MKESTSPAQIGDEHLSPTMDDRADKICDALGVSREEAIYYLEGFLWDVDEAREGCRSQTLKLPSLTVKSSPGKEKSASEAPYTPPLKTDSRPSSIQSRNELIKSFCEAAFGATVEEAVQYLERKNWDPNQAFNCFLDERRRKPSQRKSNLQIYRPASGRSNSQLTSGRSNSQDTSSLMGLASVALELNSKSYQKGFSGDARSMAEAKSELMQEFLRRLPTPSEFQNRLNEVQISAVEVDSTGSLDDEGGGEHIPEARPVMASSQVKIQDIQESTSPAQIKEETLSPLMVSEESSEALPSPTVSNSSMSSSQLSDSTEQPSQLSKELIHLFCEVAIGASPEEAIACLNHCNRNVEDAISYFFGNASSQVGIQNIQESASPAQIREETLSPVEESAEAVRPMVIESSRNWNQLQDSPEKPSPLDNKLIDLFLEAAGGVTRDDAIAYLRLCNWDVNQAVCCLIEEGPHEEETSQVQASHGSRNQGYLEDDETGSSSSSCSVNADSSEKGNVTVAIPGTASSQVDENAVEEDSSAEFSPVPITTTTIEIRMDDGGSGTEVWIPFRSDETVRDIRNRIEALSPPANNRDYYFKSDAGVEYKDLNTTVHIITSGSPGSTILHQLYYT